MASTDRPCVASPKALLRPGVENWRLKWALKLRKFVQEVYNVDVEGERVEKEITMLLNGEDPYAQAEEDDDEDEDAEDRNIWDYYGNNGEDGDEDEDEDVYDDDVYNR